MLVMREYYLTNHTLQVTIKGNLSEGKHYIMAGLIPQDSCLSPILFNVLYRYSQTNTNQRVVKVVQHLY